MPGVRSILLGNGSSAGLATAAKGARSFCLSRIETIYCHGESYLTRFCLSLIGVTLYTRRRKISCPLSSPSKLPVDARQEGVDGASGGKEDRR